ncbi:MAG: hypothetical protein ACE5LC_05295 [Candidatus Aminicenantales bacterium]
MKGAETMDEEKKKRIVEFRFGVMADLVGHRRLSWGERGRLLEEKASQHWEFPFSTLINLKKEFPKASVLAILRTARVRKLLPADFKVTRSTLYRLFREHGLMEKGPAPEDRKRFEAALANEIWQSDALHGPKSRRRASSARAIFSLLSMTTPVLLLMPSSISQRESTITMMRCGKL